MSKNLRSFHFNIVRMAIIVIVAGLTTFAAATVTASWEGGLLFFSPAAVENTDSSATGANAESTLGASESPFGVPVLQIFGHDRFANRLVTFNSNAPGVFTSNIPITGLSRANKSSGLTSGRPTTCFMASGQPARRAAS